MKEKIRKEYYRQAGMVLNTEWNSRNTISVINSLVVSLVFYNLHAMSWSSSEHQRIDIKIRNLLTVNRMH